MAPEVPHWPGSVRVAEIGASWPGAARLAAGSPDTVLPSDDAAILPSDDAASRPGGVAGILFPAIIVLLLLGGVGVWGFLDGERRELQLVALAVILAVAVVALGVSAYRHRHRF